MESINLEVEVTRGVYKKQYDEIKRYAKSILGRIHHICTNDYSNKDNVLVFTDHGTDHSERIIKYLNQLLTILRAKLELNQEEQFVLLCAAWLHDVGMFIRNPDFPDANTQRKYHGRVARSVIRDISEKINFDRKDLITAIAEVSELHQTKIKKLDVLDSALISLQRRNDLGSLLLLADAIDICSKRVQTDEVSIIKHHYSKINSSSVAEWWINDCISEAPEIELKTNILVIKYKLKPNYLNGKFYQKKILEKYIASFLQQYIVFDHYNFIKQNRNFNYFDGVVPELTINRSSNGAGILMDPPYNTQSKLWVDHFIDYKNDSLHKYLSEIKSAVNAHDVYLFVYDDVRNVIRYLVIPDYLEINDNLRNPLDSIENKNKKLRLLYNCRIPPKWGIIGHVYYCALEEYVETIKDDPRTLHDKSDEAMKLDSVLFYPLIDNKELYAVVMVNRWNSIDKEIKDYFTKDDMSLLKKAVEEKILIDSSSGSEYIERKSIIIKTIKEYASTYM